MTASCAAGAVVAGGQHRGDPPPADRWFADLGVEVKHSTGQPAQGQLGDGQQVVSFGWAEPGADTEQLAAGHGPQLAAQLVRGSGDEVADLVQRLSAALVRAAVDNLERPQRLYRAVVALRPALRLMSAQLRLGGCRPGAPQSSGPRCSYLASFPTGRGLAVAHFGQTLATRD